MLHRTCYCTWKTQKWETCTGPTCVHFLGSGLNITCSHQAKVSQDLRGPLLGSHLGLTWVSLGVSPRVSHLGLTGFSTNRVWGSTLHYLIRRKRGAAGVRYHGCHGIHATSADRPSHLRTICLLYTDLHRLRRFLQPPSVSCKWHSDF